MTPHAIGFFAIIFCVSAVIGALLGILCGGREAISIVCSFVASLLFFAVLEWQVASPGVWSPQHPITSLAYLFGPFLVLAAFPSVVAALVVSRWIHATLRARVPPKTSRTFAADCLHLDPVRVSVILFFRNANPDLQICRAFRFSVSRTAQKISAHWRTACRVI